MLTLVVSFKLALKWKMLSSESLRASNYDTYPSSVLRTMLTGLIGSQIALSISADKSQLSFHEN